jgi:hypothetical protein
MDLTIEDLAHGLYRGHPPKTLYHYTSAEVLMSIAVSRAIWASDLRYMSDASELAYAEDVFSTALKQLSADSRRQDDQSQLIFSQLERWLSVRFVSGAMVFVACFTQHGNSLVNGVDIPRTGEESVWDSLRSHSLKTCTLQTSHLASAFMIRATKVSWLPK